MLDENTQTVPLSGTHFCARCERWQPRSAIHFCEPTKRWLRAKAEDRIEYYDPRKPVNRLTENAPFSGENTPEVSILPEKLDKIAIPVNNPPKPVNRVPEIVNKPVPVNTSESVNSEKTGRKAYLKEYMRKKRAAAKEGNS